jgi:hypothetical protein
MFGVLIIHAKEFETVLLADLEKLNVYYPERKGIFDTRLLVSEAESAFSKNILNKLDKQAIQEINAFGKCIAFDNYTASGFHILRALEVVLHDLWVKECNHKPEELLGSWAAYLSDIYNLCQTNKLSKKESDEIKKLYYLLQQIKYQDRNNIMHPEITLNEDDALSLFDTVKTAIKVMTEI